MCRDDNLLAPPFKVSRSLPSIVVNTPVDSTTKSAPSADHGISMGSLQLWYRDGVMSPFPVLEQSLTTLSVHVSLSAAVG